jgi:hypothetical protein
VVDEQATAELSPAMGFAEGVAAATVVATCSWTAWLYLNRVMGRTISRN